MRDLAADLALAKSLADLADEITQVRYQALDLKIETKPDLTPVTDADKAVEKVIRERLSKDRPDDLIVGEEFGAADIDSGKYYWVIDPIDGTKNFLRGVPTWATLIGLCNPSGEVVVGVVSAPALYRRWYAALGQGAFVVNGKQNPKQIHVSAVKDLKDASLSYSDLIGWGERKEKMLDLQEKIWRTRAHGDFWSHVLVAEGAVDIAAEPSLAIWDIAAIDIIVREAGGRFTSIDGKDGIHGASAVTSNGHLHDALIKELN